MQSLASPQYLHFLATEKYFENPAFVAYLAYLQYFTLPPYVSFLMYPGPTLRHLELLQQERFRTDIGKVEVMLELFDEGVKAATAWPSSGN